MKLYLIRSFFKHKCSAFFFSFITLFVFHSNVGMSQNTNIANSINLIKGEKRVNLKKYNEFNVVYHKTSRGLDSVSTEVFTKEMRVRKDTLIVKPTDITTFRLMDTLRPYNESRYYPGSTTTRIKIPMREVEYIKAKRQPLNNISSTILSISYVTLLCSPFIAMSQNPKVSNFGIGLFLVSVPTLAVSFTTNAIWGKKKFRFDRKRTHKRVWEVTNWGPGCRIKLLLLQL